MIFCSDLYLFNTDTSNETDVLIELSRLKFISLIFLVCDVTVSTSACYSPFVFLREVSNKEVPVDFLQGIFIKFVAEFRVRS